MKKFTNVLALGAAVFSLAACASGNKVTEEKFKEEASNLPAASYTEATLKIKASYHIEGTGLFDGDTTVDGTYTYKYDSEEGVWVAQEEDGDGLEDNIFSLKEMDLNAAFNLEDIEDIDQEAKDSVQISYFINPLKVEMKINYSGNTETEGITVNSSAKGNGSIEFDKYGYVTKSTVKMDIVSQSSGKVAGVDMTMKMVMNISQDYTVSYK